MSGLSVASIERLLRWGMVGTMGLSNPWFPVLLLRWDSLTVLNLTHFCCLRFTWQSTKIQVLLEIFYMHFPSCIYLFLADFLIEWYFMVPGNDNLVGVWQGAQPFVELSNLMRNCQNYRLDLWHSLRTDFPDTRIPKLMKNSFYYQPLAARSGDGLNWQVRP